MLCLFCVEKLRSTCEFRKQCLSANQFWGIQFGRKQSKSIDVNFKIISTIDSHLPRYEFVPINKQSKDPETHIKIEEAPIMNEIKKEMIEDPVPLVGNMKNKLNSLLKLNALEPPPEKVESPEEASILSLRLGRRKRPYKKKTQPTSDATPDKPKNVKTENVPDKPILSIDKLKQNLNKRISIAAAVDIKSEPDDDDDVPLKTLKRKLSDIAKKAAPVTVAPLVSPIKLNIFNLKNKLVTALKIGESLTENQQKERRPKKHGLIVDYNQIIADKKNNIYYCKYCFKYFRNVDALRYHVVQHAKSRIKKLPKTVEKVEVPDEDDKGKKTTQCDICQKWYLNVQLHKIRSHFNKNGNKKTENRKK